MLTVLKGFWRCLESVYTIPSAWNTCIIPDVELVHVYADISGGFCKCSSKQNHNDRMIRQAYQKHNCSRHPGIIVQPHSSTGKHLYYMSMTCQNVFETKLKRYLWIFTGVCLVQVKHYKFSNSKVYGYHQNKEHLQVFDLLLDVRIIVGHL